MKKNAIIISILLIWQLLSVADPIIPVENRTILNNIQHSMLKCEALWTPTTEDTEEALEEIIKYIKNPENYKNDFQKQEIPKIVENLSQYQVQFIGIIVEGKKKIHCNFFKTTDQEYNWKESYHFVYDGGFWYWRIEYDMKTGRCMNFESNGYA